MSALTLPAYALSRRELRDAGMRRRDIDDAVAAGRLVRVRRDRYLPGDAHPDLIRAARSGDRLDCVSLLRTLGVYVLSDTHLHVQVTPHRSSLAPAEPDVVRHWRPASLPTSATAVDIVSAVVAAVRCQEPRAAVATLDSAWHLGLIDETDIAEAFRRLPQRHRSLRSLMDPSAESGPETLMRLILRSLGCRFETQVRIPTVGRVDFVVEGWLIIECDSRAHHEGWEAQKRDRRRDLAAAALGYATVRPLAEDIQYHRDRVRTSISCALARH